MLTIAAGIILAVVLLTFGPALFVLALIAGWWFLRNVVPVLLIGGLLLLGLHYGQSHLTHPAHLTGTRLK